MQEIEGDKEYRSKINLYKKDAGKGKGVHGSGGGHHRGRNDDVINHEDVSVNMNVMDDEEVRLDELLDDMSLGDGDHDDDYNEEDDEEEEGGDGVNIRNHHDDDGDL